MFINLSRPQADMVFPGDNVLTSAAATAVCAPWVFNLDQLDNAAEILHHQQRLLDMSFNSAALTRGSAQQPGSKRRREQQQQGLVSAYSSGYYPVEPHLGGKGDLFTTGPGQSTTGHRTVTPLPPNQLYVSPYAAPVDGGMICHPSSASMVAEPDLLDTSLFWQVPTHAAGQHSALSSFASLVADSPHQDHHTASSLDYNLGVISQTVFESDTASHSHGLPSDAMLEGDTTGSHSSAATASDMLEAMVINDGPHHPQSWNVSLSSVSGSHQQPGYRGGGLCVGTTAGQHEISTGSWMPVEGQTVSPKMLRIRPTPTPTSSSDSIRTSFLGNNTNTGEDDQAAYRMRHGGGGSACPMPPKSRKQLPDRGHGHGQPAQTLAQFGQGGSKSPMPSLKKLSKVKPKYSNNKAMPSSPISPSTTVSTTATHPLTTAASSQISGSGPVSVTTTTRSRSSAGGEDLCDRSAKDEFLVKHKQLGLTYKEIRRMGGFTEAESTLRGRYRTLTKSREARVRKPEWSEKDLRLLEKGVRRLAQGWPGPSGDFTSAKVPWKKVAEYIVAHGGSYHFGNSTCRKRWDELVREQTALGKDLRQPFFAQNYRDGDDEEELKLGGGGTGTGSGYFPGAAAFGGYGHGQQGQGM